MADRVRVRILNGTCLDVVDRHVDWLTSLPAEFRFDTASRPSSLEQFAESLQQVDAVIGPTAIPIQGDLLNACPELRVISLASSGFDTVDLEAATRARIVVTNAPARELAEAVADLTWGLLLAVSRQIPYHDRLIRSGILTREFASSPWRKTLGVVGLGMIGKAVVRRAQGFDMRVLAATNHDDDDFVTSYGVELVDLETLLAESDYVSLHGRLNEDTRHMIAARELAQMKRSAFLINTARRELVDEQALKNALARGQLAGAALDDPPSQFGRELLGVSNVVFTTHLGNRTREAADAVFRLAVKNALDVLAGHPTTLALNPQIYEPTRGGTVSTAENAS